jgi:hypothetical protein
MAGLRSLRTPWVKRNKKSWTCARTVLRRNRPRRSKPTGPGCRRRQSGARRASLWRRGMAPKRLRRYGGRSYKDRPRLRYASGPTGWRASVGVFRAAPERLTGRKSALAAIAKTRKALRSVLLRASVVGGDRKGADRPLALAYGSAQPRRRRPTRRRR